MTTTQDAVIPKFDDEVETDRKLAIICSKGNLDMAYPGLIIGNAALGEGVETHLFFTFWGFDMIMKSRMNNLQFSPAGNAALGEGVETHLFFTFWGFDMITKSRMHDLKFTPVGNTATHMPMGITPFPGVTGMATHQLKKSIADLGVPEVPEFLDQIVAAGGHLWACRLSADMNHLTDADLYEGVEGIISASDFIELTNGAQLLFI